MQTRRRFLVTTTLAAAATALPRSRSFALPEGEGFATLRRNIGTFTARGGTIGWLSTDDTLVVIDAQFPEQAATCWAALDPAHAKATAETKPSGGRMIDVFLNTHHHPDHTAGNVVFAPHAKQHVAHVNCPLWQKKRAEADGGSSAQAYARTTFETTWKADVGSEVVRADYLGPAHTSGDVVIHFEKANVAHVGDLVFNRLPPFIDRPAGASIQGWASILEKLHGAYADDTLFIFGHGAPSAGITGKRSDLLAMRDFLAGLLDYTAAGLGAGKSVDELAAIDRLPKFPDYYTDARKEGIPTAVRIAAEEIQARD